MAGTNILTSILDLVSQSLQIPVIIFLLVFAIGAIILLGGLIREYTHRKTVSNMEMKTLINSISNASTQDEILNIIQSSQIPNSMKNDLKEITDTDLDLESRIALAKKLVNSREKKLEKRLSYTDIITRIGPTLGLMGTLIPMGPGLAALGSGDIVTLYSEYIANIDVLSDVVLTRIKRL